MSASPPSPAEPPQNGTPGTTGTTGKRPVAELIDVTLTRGSKTVLAGARLSIRPGELLTIVGPSGSGKSSLLSLLAGLLTPTSGTLTRPEDLGGKTRLVFQQPHLLPWRTAFENVRLGLEYRANGGAGLGHAHAADRRVLELLTELGIHDLAHHTPDELSGGQAQRVAIARAVAAHPSLLLLDEPFSALDPLTRADAQQWLRRIHRHLGLSTVLVTHDLAEAVSLGDRVLVLTGDTTTPEPIESAGRDTVQLEAELLERFTSALAPHIAPEVNAGTAASDGGEAQPGAAQPDAALALATARPKRSRREFLSLAAAGSLVLLPGVAGLLAKPAEASPLGTGAAAAPSTDASSAAPLERATLRIGYLPITDAAPLLLAHDSGAFAERGIDTPAPTLFRGWAPLVEALQGGSIDVAHLLMPLAMQLRYEAGLPLKVLAWNHVNGSALAVRHEISGISDLAGTTVAVPGWYSIHNVVLQQLLRSAGLTAVINTTPSVEASTVQLVVLPPADMPVALANGSVSAFIVAEPFCAVVEVQGTGKILRFTGDVWREHACCVTVVREDLVTGRPELAQRVADAVVAAQQGILADRGAAAARLSAGGYLPQSPEAIARVLNEQQEAHAHYESEGAIRHPDWNQERIDFQPYAYPSYTERLVEELRRTAIDANTDWLHRLNPATVHADLVTTDINLRAIESAGGLSAFGATRTRKELIAP